MQDVTTLGVVSTLDRITQVNHRHLLRITRGGQVFQAVLEAGNPVAGVRTLAGASLLQTAGNFIKLGVEHIFTGYDHLAFLLGLLSTTTTLLSLLQVVTSFTVAHSVTLGLATFELVALPSKLIESLIALSIAYVAIENLTRKTVAGRWRITFLFGLVHGFGFSNVLRAMELPRKSLAILLFSFNAGVEIGQLTFVLLVFPLIIYVRSSRWNRQCLPAISAAIMCLGMYWFVRRTFLS